MQGSGPPLVLLHGFTQTGRLWGPFGARLALERTLISIDLPGHAGSDGIRADLPATAEMVAESVRSVLGTEDSCALLGYSLGARVALHVALSGTLPLAQLVLIGGTGGLEDPEARQRRRAADEVTADALDTSGDVAGFLQRWLSGPMFGHLADDAVDIEERRRNSASGLASSLRLAGTGTQVPLWGELWRLEVPLLAMAGLNDNRFTAHALRLAEGVPSGVASLVAGAGHAAHLAQPELTSCIIGHWLATT
jgi:2-succinyl-6-hydroxy-2,4-cyclohexadiene-1-carboxylate synthase